MSITNVCIPYICRVSSLKTFDFYDNTKMSGDQFVYISDLKNLTKLYVPETFIGEKAFASFDPCVMKLTRIDISGCDEVVDSCLDYISKFAFLEYLDVSYCIHIGDRGLCYLSELKCLKELWVCEVDISDVGMSHISKISSLRSIYMSDCKGVSDDGLKELSNLHLLQILEVDGCTGLSDYGMAYFSGHKYLKEVDVSNCDMITEETVHLLKTVNVCGAFVWPQCDLRNAIPLPELPSSPSDPPPLLNALNIYL